MNAFDRFQVHLNWCRQCQKEPGHKPCLVGAALAREAVEFLAAMNLKGEYFQWQR